MENKYKEQAEKFLTDTKTTLEIVKTVPQKSPLWSKDNEKHGINYICTLKNKNATYTFDFWDSIKDSEIVEAIETIAKSRNSYDSERVRAEKVLENNGIDYHGLSFSKEKKEKLLKEYTPEAYSILACLSPLYEDNFSDFCSSYGYDEDSITALKTFEAVKEQDRNIRKLWDRSEIKKLEEIQ